MVELIAALALTTVPFEPAVVSQCERQEFNSFYSHEGELTFHQLILWDWTRAPQETEPHYHTQAWRLARHKDMYPLWDQRLGCYVARFFDGETFREVRSRLRLRSWTQHDPEQLDRECIPDERRRGLLDPGHGALSDALRSWIEP